MSSVSHTRGHSDRVSRGSGMIARQIGMRADRAEAIRFAGMLHDVGKLGVPTKVLQKTGVLTEEEYAAIQLHPMRGLEIVREIGFLNEALTGTMPALVDAFVAALRREGWELPTLPAVPLDREMVTAQDHDDPTAPLRVVETF